MSDYVIVRINEKLIPEFQTNYNANNRLAKKRVINSWSDILVKNNETLVLIISANLVYSNQVVIPSKNEEVIRQSIPFTLEESLANDISDNHYAYRELTENKFSVSCINKLLMDKIISKLVKNNLKCKELYSEIYSVPLHSGQSSVVITKNYCIVRNDNNGDNNGTSIKESMLKHYHQSNKTESQIVYSQHEFDTKILKNSTSKIVDISLLQARTLTENDKVNLFQAQYSQNTNSKKSVNPLKRIALLSAVLIMSWLLINGYNLMTVSSEVGELKNKQAELLLKLIPNASETERKDPYSAIQSRLKVSQNQSSNDSVGFIQTLSYLGQTLALHPSIQVQSLRQRNSKLEVSVRAQDTSKLNKFQSDLEKNVLAMSVKTGTREVNNNGVNSIITMESLQ